MKKEITLVTAAGLFLLAYLLDFIAGPTNLVVKNPVIFLSHAYLSKFPLTAVAIGIRTAALFLTIILTLSFINHKYFSKAFFSFVLGGIGELYAIQQLATGNRITTPQWTLSFAYLGGALVVAIVYYFLKGIIFGLKRGLSDSDEEESDSKNDSQNGNNS